MSRLAVVLCLSALAAGCVVTKTEVVRIRHADGSAPSAPAANRPSVADHVVARGETLYSIAFRNKLDWRQVAAWNRLPEPYTIYPGQRLRLSGPEVPGTGPATPASTVAAAPSTPLPPGGVEARPVTDAGEVATAAPPAASPPVSSPASTLPATPPAPSTPAPPTSPTPATTAQVAVVPPPATTAPSTPPPVATTAPPPAPAETTPAVPAPAIEPSATASVGGIQWRWPTQGELIQRFNTSDLTRQGIAVSGRAGQVVVAAADGEIVYSGAGLRGYGELIIIKHSPEYLSAYGHNRKRLVNEGQRVKAGQPIAELGRTGADRDKLHFEIRRGGKPVDPLAYLPRR